MFISQPPYPYLPGKLFFLLLKKKTQDCREHVSFHEPHHSNFRLVMKKITDRDYPA